ncbi:protein LURP-one-related 6 [Magnolia sinica]|uniref:protein LURP-one-related 6 n=1 Tax=Magnolia sinica TaxID=86752 RepID=UPI002658FCBC|nr:protein LURP-one-related 6 [Magnolia sinica]
MAVVTNLTPVVSKLFCSSTQVDFIVRSRPHVVNGGGLVVTDRSQKVVFRIDGCGTIGSKGKLILRDGDGSTLLFIRRKGGTVQALSVYKQWKGYQMDYEGEEKLVFCIKEPNSWIARTNKIRGCIEPKKPNVDWDFEIKGSFVNRACSINDRRGNIVAQMSAWEEAESLSSKDVYRVLVQPGFDQAFVFGVIAVLDNIHGESTRC